jgi:hypothetical protein
LWVLLPSPSVFALRCQEEAGHDVRWYTSMGLLGRRCSTSPWVSSPSTLAAGDPAVAVSAIRAVLGVPRPTPGSAGLLMVARPDPGRGSAALSVTSSRVSWWKGLVPGCQTLGHESLPRRSGHADRHRSHRRPRVGQVRAAAPWFRERLLYAALSAWCVAARDRRPGHLQRASRGTPSGHGDPGFVECCQ